MSILLPHRFTRGISFILLWGCLWMGAFATPAKAALPAHVPHTVRKENPSVLTFPPLYLSLYSEIEHWGLGVQHDRLLDDSWKWTIGFENRCLFYDSTFDFRLVLGVKYSIPEGQFLGRGSFFSLRMFPGFRCHEGKQYPDNEKKKKKSLNSYYR